MQISHKPETIDDIEAAGVLYAGLTAWSGLYISGHIGGILGALTSQGWLIACFESKIIFFFLKRKLPNF